MIDKKKNNTNKAGLESAAILLLSLDPDEAASIMKHLGPKQVQRLGAAMAAIKNIQKEKVKAVLEDFFNQISKQTSLGVAADEHIRQILIKSLGEEKAATVIDKIFVDGKIKDANKGLDTLKWMEPRSVADIIRYEHPQIQSLVLSYLEPQQAAEVLPYFDDRTRVDLIMRIASQEAVQPAAITELNSILEKHFQGHSISQAKEVGGIKVAANIMNFVESSAESKIMTTISEKDSDMSTKIQDLMFVFENLLEVDDRSIQTILREISNDVLILALKGSGDEMKEKIFANMSKRAAEMLRDDLKAKGPVRLSEVETAQKQILAVAKRLAEEGQIMLGALGGEEMI